MELPSKGENLDALLSGCSRRGNGPVGTGGETFISVSVTYVSIKHMFSSIIDSVECRSESPTCKQLQSHIKQVAHFSFLSGRALAPKS